MFIKLLGLGFLFFYSCPWEMLSGIKKTIKEKIDLSFYDIQMNVQKNKLVHHDNLRDIQLIL